MFAYIRSWLNLRSVLDTTVVNSVHAEGGTGTCGGVGAEGHRGSKANDSGSGDDGFEEHDEVLGG